MIVTEEEKIKRNRESKKERNKARRNSKNKMFRCILWRIAPRNRREAEGRGFANIILRA